MLARLITLVLLLAPQAFAAPTLDVQIGFGGRQRVDRWNPIFLTLRNDQPTSAAVTVSVGEAMKIHRLLGIGPQASTYVVQAPMAEANHDVAVDVVDTATGKSLIHWPTDKTPPLPTDADGPLDFFILTAGRAPALRGITRSTDNAITSVQSVNPAFLPVSAIGYDAVDLLFLNDPDWGALPVAQQRAILGWVESGGVLMLWPGADALPANMPLADALPVQLGDTVPLTIDAAALRRADLPDRFATIPQRLLTPKPNVARVPLIGNASAAVSRCGLGRVIVLPIDASSLLFKTNAGASRFWNNLFDPVFGRPSAQNSAMSHYMNNPSATVAQQALDRIGNLPKVGTFSFYYVMLVIGGMILLVGPVDYFLLRRLRRQPLTWATTAVWIALITTGALYAGQFVQSGQLYFRTLHLIEQADQHVVAQDEITLTYAPRSDRYPLQSTGDFWWQGVPENRRLGATPLSQSIDFIQDDHSNVPLPAWIDVWNWQFLLGTSYQPKPALIKADLSVRGDHIQGVLNNIGAVPLRNFTIQVADRAAVIGGQVLPGEALRVDADLNSTHDHEFDLFDLNEPRTQGFHRPQLAGFAKTATLYAELPQSDVDLTLEHSNVNAEHTGLLRATVELLP